MSLNKRLIEALSPLAPAAPDAYEGGESVYFVFNYNSIPSAFCDGAPSHEKHLVQVHLFCPKGFNSLAIRKKAKRRLFAAGLTWPDELNAGIEATDVGRIRRDSGADVKQHYVFECECAERIDYDGDI